MKNLIIKDGALNQLPTILPTLTPATNQLFVVTDKTLYSLYGSKISMLLVNYEHSFIVIEEGEQHKNDASLNQIYHHLYQHGCRRSSVIIAFGGGLIGDLATMAAATFNRGCFLVQIPTTLLAQTDSCLGGKGAINYHLAKNLIGVFYPAHFIIVDPTLLQSLSVEEFKSGMAEVIKYAVIADAKLFNQLAQLSIDSIKPCLAAIIKRCLSIKMQLVKIDPYDQGLRAKLNFGHTLGHALEAASGGKLKHGLAVAKGMVAVSIWGEQLGVTQQGVANNINNLLCHWRLETSLNKPAIDPLKKFILADKKREGNSINIIFATTIGHSVIKKIPFNMVNDWVEHLT